MSKDFAWDLFKSTGNVDAFMIMKNLENGAQSTQARDVKNVLDNRDEK